jgi:hypothetical protein
MKTVAQMVDELEHSKAEYVTYGDCETSVRREYAIADIKTMDDDQIGEGDWYECNAEGQVID